MLLKEISLLAKKEKVYVSFDMDGVIAEYDVSKTDEHKKKTDNFYINKRPMKTVIKFMKKLSKKGVTVLILSCCHFENQKEEKILWLKKHVPFLKAENIHIICYENVESEKLKDKYSLKTQYLEKLFENRDGVVFHVDDDVRVISSMKKSDRINVKHISSLIK